MIGPRQLILISPSGEDFKTLTMGNLDKLKLRHMPYICNTIGTYVDRNQNLAVTEGLSHSTIEWFMFIDSDMLFPEIVVDALAAQKRDIVGCDYRTRQPPHLFTSVKLTGERADGTDTGYREVKSIPSGMMLIRRRVFETVPYPWFFNSYGASDAEFVGNDVNFCWKARAAGFKVWCDYHLSREIRHFGGCAIGWGGIE